MRCTTSRQRGDRDRFRRVPRSWLLDELAEAVDEFHTPPTRPDAIPPFSTEMMADDVQVVKL